MESKPVEIDYTERYLRRARTVLAVLDSYPRRRRAPLVVQIEPGWPRGVYEMEVAPKGYRAFNVVYSNGDIAFHQFPSDRVTRELVRGLKRALERDDPVALQLV